MAAFFIHFFTLSQILQLTTEYTEKFLLKSISHNTSGKAGGLKNVNRSKRLKDHEPPKGGLYSNSFSWSNLRSSCSWCFMYSLISSSSLPNVDTKYPLGPEVLSRKIPLAFTKIPCDILVSNLYGACNPKQYVLSFFCCPLKTSFLQTLSGSQK